MKQCYTSLCQVNLTCFWLSSSLPVDVFRKVAYNYIKIMSIKLRQIKEFLWRTSHWPGGNNDLLLLTRNSAMGVSPSWEWADNSRVKHKLYQYLSDQELLKGLAMLNPILVSILGIFLQTRSGFSWFSIEHEVLTETRQSDFPA